MGTEGVGVGVFVSVGTGVCVWGVFGGRFEFVSGRVQMKSQMFGPSIFLFLVSITVLSQNYIRPLSTTFSHI